MADHSPPRDDSFNTPSFTTISDYDNLEQNLELNLSYAASENPCLYLTDFKFKVAPENNLLAGDFKLICNISTYKTYFSALSNILIFQLILICNILTCKTNFYQESDLMCFRRYNFVRKFPAKSFCDDDVTCVFYSRS